MGETKNEYRLLLPLLPFLVIVPYLALQTDSHSTDFAWLIVVAPFIMFPIILITGQVFNKNETWKNTWKEGGILGLAALSVSLSTTIWIVYDYLIGHADITNSGVDSWLEWISFDVLQSDYTIAQNRILGVGVWIDSLTLMLLFVATFLCFLICWFAIGYMTTDPINEDSNHRFFAEFVLFSLGMFGMVLADNFLWLFIFWEVMGLCSYLLIGFYYWKDSAAAAAKKAFLTTRVGDVFLMVGLLILYDIYGSLDFAVVFDDPSTGIGGVAVESGELFWALMMLFIGAVGKSAQFPLHVWLPDAMEGPTPVSALIHAATMVNAGLYLVARLMPFVDIHHNGVAGLEDFGLIVAWIGGITAFMAASIAFVQNDIKKVLAYSTMSQLAYIFTGLGSALYFLNTGDHHAGYFVLGASLFHLFNHAMAKGMLFMASGSVIHEVHHAHDHLHHGSNHSDHDFDPQDMRNMGGIASKMPVTSTAMMFGSMSIIGIPLIGGFWSKEGIIAETWLAYFHGETMMLGPALLILATAGMTGFYMSRMWFMTFAGQPKSDVVEHIHEATPWIKEPLLILTFITAIGGFALATLGIIDFLSNESHHLSLHGHSLQEQILHELEHAFLPEDNKLRMVGWTTILLSFVIGPIMAARIHGGKLKEGQKANIFVGWLVNLSDKFGTQDVTWLAESQLAEALDKRLYFDDLYEGIIARTVIPFAELSAWFDKNIIDGIIKQIESNSVLGSVQIRKVTTGSARDYILMATVGALCIFALLVGVNN
ncbi:NADH-quinone oxidoreductase subunit L [Euryarchaeota archaeon]|nr:NADH-quinone oxidoreductase subunit L [Euryarchaeota archaeon]MDC1029034.1 NADH-quinone oxidoreductase subunit L [Euryarchaeota archaeon]